jgi:hypothetical protein
VVSGLNVWKFESKGRSNRRVDCFRRNFMICASGQIFLGNGITKDKWASHLARFGKIKISGGFKVEI